jgi:hypothetical protein
MNSAISDPFSPAGNCRLLNTAKAPNSATDRRLPEHSIATCAARRCPAS